MLNYSEEELLAKSKPYGLRDKICGVYFLFYQDILVYVGQSVDIDSRLLSHFTTKAFDRYSYIVLSEDELDDVENYYINKYKPIYNSKINGKFHRNFGYTWNGELLLLNGAYSLERRIYKRIGNNLYDVMDNSKSGVIHNKCGYVNMGDITFFCFDNTAYRTKLSKCLYLRIDFSVPNELIVYKQDFPALTYFTDVVLYAIAFNKSIDWAINEANTLGIRSSDYEKVTAEKIMGKINLKGLDNNQLY